VVTDLPEGFTLRPPVQEDGEPLVEMLNEETVKLIGVPLATLEWFLSPWNAPGADPERDFAVVVDEEGGLAGYLSVESDPPYTEVFSIGAVALRHHGRGLGAALVAEAERRALRFVDMAQGDRRVVMHAGALADEPRVSRLLRARGYTEVRRFVGMRVDFDQPPAPAASIEGIDIRRAALGEEAHVYACLADAFADHWGETWPTEETWTHRNVEAGDADPTLWQLAWHGSELAGALVAEPRAAEDPALGYISALGVRGSYRRRGIGEALLRSSFVEFCARGIRGVALHVDAKSITGATRLYERVGMTSEPRFAQWEKELRPAQRASRAPARR
jgi:mycothiol synthase